MATELNIEVTWNRVRDEPGVESTLEYASNPLLGVPMIELFLAIQIVDILAAGQSRQPQLTKIILAFAYSRESYILLHFASLWILLLVRLINLILA